MVTTKLIDPNWKMPPLAKVYEALSAVVDNRVTLIGSDRAAVVSSSLDKSYTVEWSSDGKEITSNDNASYWQGYIGYPIIAVFLSTGKIAYDKEAASSLAGIPWKQLNKQHKGNYDKAVAAVLESLEAKGTNIKAIADSAQSIFDQLQRLDIKKYLSRRRPPPVS